MPCMPNIRVPYTVEPPHHMCAIDCSLAETTYLRFWKVLDGQPFASTSNDGFKLLQWQKASVLGDEWRIAPQEVATSECSEPVYMYKSVDLD